MIKKEIISFTSTRVTIRRAGILAAISCLFTISAAGCGPTPPPPDTDTPVVSEYIGRVIDGYSLQSIKDAKVTLDLLDDPLIAYTDAEGVYHFNILITSSISGQVKVEAQGYQIYTRNISVFLNNKRMEDIRLTSLSAPSTSPQPPTSTFTAEPTSTFTVTPTLVPVSPQQAQSFAEGCVSSRTWTPRSTDVNILNSIIPMSHGCYDMGAMGIFADGAGFLHIFDRNKRTFVASGIETPINNDSVIEFKVFVNSMYLAESGNLLYASFAVASVNDPTSEKNSARFKLQVDETKEKPIIVFVLADAGENTGAPVEGRHYRYGYTYTIRLELTGNVMGVYIDNTKMHEMLDLPVGPKVFHIGYNLPAFASIDMNVFDLKIDGVLK